MLSPDDKLVQAMTEEAMAKSRDFQTLGVAHMLWAFAKLGLSPGGRLAQAMTLEAVTKSGDLNAQQICNTLWAYAVLDSHPGAAVVAQLLDELAGSLGEQDLTLEEKDQLHQFFLWHGLEGLQAHQALAQDCRQTFTMQAASTRNRMSAFHWEVRDCLRSIGVHSQDNVVLGDTCYCVNLLLDGDERKVVVEVDGPCRYVNGSLVSGEADWRSKGLRWNGATQLKDRLLRKKGWSVLHVPFYEWYALKGVEQKNEYLEGGIILALSP